MSSSNQERPQNSNKNRNRNYNRNNKRRNDSIIRKLESNTHLSKEHFAIVKSIRRTTDKIVTYIDPCSEVQLLWSVSPDKWNIKEILAHLNQVNVLYLERMNHILEERQDDLPLFVADEEIKKEEFASYSIERLLREFIMSRKEIDSLCMKTVDDDWLKVANHPEKGEQTFKDVVEYIVTHDDIHLNQIFMNLQRHDPWFKEEVKTENELQEQTSETSVTENE